MNYHVDRFHSAVMTLAGDGNVKQRLQKAFEEDLEPIDEDELPGELKGDFRALKTRMTSVEPVTGEGSVCATVRKMSVTEASCCATSVVSMYGVIVRSARDGYPQVSQDSTDTPPPFLVKSAS